ESGAKVLNAQAVEFAKERGIAIYARATASALPGADPSADGTVVRRHPPRMPGTVVGVASEQDVFMIHLESEGGARLKPSRSVAPAFRDAPDDLGVAGKQLQGSGNRLSLVVSRENLHEEERARRVLAERFGAACTIVDTPGAVSVIGTGINASFANV